MTDWLRSTRERPRVVVAGGGVAALEACLLMREYVSADEADIELLAPSQRFTYRPLSVLESFGGPRTWSMPLGQFAADQEIDLHHSGLAAVRPSEHVVVTTAGARRFYDLLLVAIGARAVPALPGALTFQGSVDAPAIRRILDEAHARLHRTIVFAVAAGTSWHLPLYELALLTAGDLRARGATTQVVLVTPERAPLEAFGAEAADVVARLLDEHGIAVVCGAAPLSVGRNALELVDGRSIPADRVVALPRATGRYVQGLPHDASGFIPVDRHARVDGLDGVYAAGDITTFPFKQGGLASQQADAAAEAMLSDLGLPIDPRPFAPVLQGVLYGGAVPTYLRRTLHDGAGTDPSPRSYSLWWPPSKIAGRRLSAYLTLRAGAPRAPEVRPSADIVPVRVDLTTATDQSGNVADARGG